MNCNQSLKRLPLPFPKGKGGGGWVLQPIAMKKILVPTDFSENARWAVGYAAHLADALGAQVDVLHAQSVTTPTGVYGQTSEFVERKLRSDMADLIRWMEAQTHPELNPHPRIVTGHPEDAILELSREYDLIIMGTRGQSDVERWLFGSTTQAVLGRLQKPLLAIPPSCRFVKPEKVVLALDEEGVQSVGQVASLVQLLRPFAAHILVLHHDQGTDRTGLNGRLDEAFAGLSFSRHYDMGEEDLWEAIRSFTDHEKAQLITMIRRRRTGLERWFGRHETSRILNRTDRPLLLIPEHKPVDA